MTSEEKKGIAIIAFKCILAILYLCLGFHYLIEVVCPKDEEEIEIEIEEEDKHVIVNIMQFRKQHEEEEKHDA